MPYSTGNMIYSSIKTVSNGIKTSYPITPSSTAESISFMLGVSLTVAQQIKDSVVKFDSNKCPVSLFCLSSNAPTILEGNTLNFDISRTGSLGDQVPVTWTIIGTGVNPAIASDFASAITGSVVFNANELIKTISIVTNTTLTGTLLDKTFSISITPPTAQMNTCGNISGVIQQIQFYTVTVTKSGNAAGSGTVTMLGATTIQSGFLFSITANITNPYQKILGYYIGSTFVTTNSINENISFTVISDITIDVVFVKETIIVKLETTANGTVANQSIGSYTWDKGTTFTTTVTPNAGYKVAYQTQGDLPFSTINGVATTDNYYGGVPFPTNFVSSSILTNTTFSIVFVKYSYTVTQRNTGLGTTSPANGVVTNINIGSNYFLNYLPNPTQWTKAIYLNSVKQLGLNGASGNISLPITINSTVTTEFVSMYSPDNIVYKNNQVLGGTSNAMVTYTPERYTILEPTDGRYYNNIVVVCEIFAGTAANEFLMFYGGNTNVSSNLTGSNVTYISNTLTPVNTIPNLNAVANFNKTTYNTIPSGGTYQQLLLLSGFNSAAIGSQVTLNISGQLNASGNDGWFVQFYTLYY
jgi:hypothetical protein